ncbi:MAG: amidophosphoribosyltransferase, partial [Candidatus Micrarchaeota archaeon]
MGVKVLSPYSDVPHEECGIVAIFSKKGKDVAPFIYRALVALQHRGQDAAGLAVFDGHGIEARRGIGLVAEVFEGNDLHVRGQMGIGHTRYPTFGECKLCDVQPIVFQDIAVAHNGHLANYPDLRLALERDGFGFMSSVDSETMTFMLSKARSMEEAVGGMMKRLEGAYSVASIVRGKLAVFRDPFALRPLVYGENDEFICFASESVALDINGIPCKGDLRGGELAIIEGGRIRRAQIMPENARHCMFEYVYFSRPDSCL